MSAGLSSEPDGASLDDHLFVWRRSEGLDIDAAMSVLEPLAHADVLIGSVESVADDWAGRRVGCVVVKGEPRAEIASAAVDDWDLVPFPSGVAFEDDALVWAEEPLALPAAPLVVTEGRDWRFAPEVQVALELDDPREEELALLDELTELFLEAYRGEGAGALEGAALVEREGGGRTLTLTGWTPPDAEVARGHLHWWIEELARFLPLRSARITTGGSSARRGLRPSWLGPLLVIAAAFGTRLLEPDLALRAGMLAWAFGPLIITFLSRAHVGRITWAMAVANALVQAALAFLVVQPELIAGPPPAEGIEELLAWTESVRSIREWLLYGSGIIGLGWVLVYLANRRRPV